MAFYIKPPEGFGNLERLRIYSLRRMNFLAEVLACKDADDFRSLLEKGSTAVDSDCLIEGSRKDRVSHFLLRLMCSQDRELSHFFIQAETELFCHRFSCMNSEELVHLLSSTYKFLSRLHRRKILQSNQTQSSRARRTSTASSISKRHQAYSESLDNLLSILTSTKACSGSWEAAVALYMEYSSSVFCVPFQHALCLVASRQVTLEQGMAYVQFSNLHIVMANLFEAVVREGLKVAGQVPQQLMEDARLRGIVRDARTVFYRSRPSSGRLIGRDRGGGKVIREEDIDGLHHFFPPCMSHLHRTLRRKHRLRHFSRIQYTLFLKDLGLPVEDAISFWRKEYSKPSGCHDESRSAGCQHSWARDGRRYTYSIRHLYGLEGSRINYRAHSCRSIQEMQFGYGEDGGCPFKIFDESNFTKMMDIEQIAGPQREDILTDRQKNRYQSACKSYLSAKCAFVTKSCDSGNSPVFETCEKDLGNSSETEKPASNCEEVRPRVETCRCDDGGLPRDPATISEMDCIKTGTGGQTLKSGVCLKCSAAGSNSKNLTANVGRRRTIVQACRCDHTCNHDLSDSNQILKQMSYHAQTSANCARILDDASCDCVKLECKAKTNEMTEGGAGSSCNCGKLESNRPDIVKEGELSSSDYDNQRTAISNKGSGFGCDKHEEMESRHEMKIKGQSSNCNCDKSNTSHKRQIMTNKLEGQSSSCTCLAVTAHNLPVKETDKCCSESANNIYAAIDDDDRTNAASESRAEKTLKRGSAISYEVQPKIPRLGDKQEECHSEKSRATQVSSTCSQEIHIFRPADFFHSFSRLVNGLKK